MSSTTWVFQRPDEIQRVGEEQASWYVGWYEPDGTRKHESCGPGFRGKKAAERKRNKVENELMCGTYQKLARVKWDDFVTEYERRILSGLALWTRQAARVSLAHFKRLVKPIRVFALLTCHVDEFITARRQEPGKRKGERVSPASVNKDLRHIKAALRVAQDWGYLPQMPKFRMEKEPKKLPTFLPEEDFAVIYYACDKAKKPADQPYPAADWWRGLLVTGYLTGWRIGQLLALRRDDLDLQDGCAITRHTASGNKGKRDQRVKLHALVVEHLRRMPGFSPTVFPWNHNRRTLDDEFLRIQQAAGIHLPCAGEHEHTAECHVYSWHDLRRAFATYNADKLTPDALQALMQHKSYTTTQKYINLARQMDEAVAGLHVPDVLKKGRG